MSGSNTFGGTIKLEGEKEYRKAISQINSDLKVLASEMSKVTLEFSKNNTSTGALASKSKVLNEQIERQKEKIAILRGALEQSSEKYVENDKRTNSWRISFNKAEAELSKMENSLSEANSKMEKSQTPIDKLNQELLEQGEKLKLLQTEYKNVVLSVAQRAVTAAQWLMNAAMNANPIGLIITAIAALAGGFILLWNNCEGFRNFWISLWDETVNACISAWDTISPFFTEWIPNTFNSVINFVTNNWQGFLLLLINPFVGAFKLIYDNCEGFRIFVNNFMNSVKEFFINGWDEVVSFFTETIPDFITSVIEWLNQIPYQIGFIIGEAIGHIVKFGFDLLNFATVTVPEFINQVITFFMGLPAQIGTWLSATATKVGEFFVSLVNTGITKTIEFVNNIINFISELPEKINQWLQNTMSKIIEFFINAVNTGKSKTSAFLNNIINVIKNLPNQIGNWLSQTIQKVISWGLDLVNRGRLAANNLVSSIVNKVREIPGQMYSIGSNIVSGIWNGISNSIGWITSKVKQFARGILDGIKSALGIHSPSKVFEQEVGKNMALGVGEGFVSSMSNIQKDMQKAIPTSFNTDLNMAIAATGKPLDIQTSQPSQINATVTLVDKFKSAVENTSENISEKLDSILYFLQYYIPELQNRQICLNTGALVGELTPPINSELSKIQNSKERGR